MRTFRLEGEQGRVWTIALRGRSIRVSHCRSGTAAKTRVRDFADEAEARRQQDRLVTRRLKLGYREVTPTPAEALRLALEAALHEAPDDRAAHSAYADLLSEQGDPRSEFIAVQLALEDETLRAAQRRRLQKREADLLARHQRDWLGSLAPFLLDKQVEQGLNPHYRELQRFAYRFARGWLYRLEVHYLSTAFAQVLARAPAASLLRELVLEPHYYENYYGDELAPRGYLPRLMVEALVNSPHLMKLAHLRWRLSSAGDAGVGLLIDSGLLGRLKMLDLRHGRVTDAGARLLADCPDLPRLERLDLARNQLTAAGVTLLQATGANVCCDEQCEVGSDEYLTEGDFE
jgi:uncharacterized protein (TIGR02996 family)